MDEKRETFKIKRKRKPSQDNDFDGLVKMKMATERSKLIGPRRANPHPNSSPRGRTVLPGATAVPQYQAVDGQRDC